MSKVKPEPQTNVGESGELPPPQVVPADSEAPPAEQNRPHGQQGVPPEVQDPIPAAKEVPPEVQYPIPAAKGVPPEVQYPVPQAQGMPPIVMQPPVPQVQGMPPIVMQQPIHQAVVIEKQKNENPRPWATGLFDCFSDIGACCCAFNCSCCYLIILADKVGENICGAIACSAMYPIALRIMFRTEHNIKGDIMGDVCTSYVCCCCALRQLGTEISRQTEVQLQEMARS